MASLRNLWPLLAVATTATITRDVRANVTPSIKADKSSLSITLWPDDTMSGDSIVNVTAGLQQSSGTFGSCTKYSDINISYTNSEGLSGNDATINNPNGLCSFNPWDATPNPIPADLTDIDVLSQYYLFDYVDCPSPSYQPSTQTGTFSIMVSANTSDWSTSTDMGEIDIPYTMTCMPDSQPTVGSLAISPNSLSISVSGSTASGNGPVHFTLSRPNGGGCALADRAVLFSTDPTKHAIDTSFFGGSTCAADVPFVVGVVSDQEAVAACTAAGAAGKTVSLTRPIEADFCNGDCSDGRSNIVERHAVTYGVSVACPVAPPPQRKQFPAGATVYKPAGPITKLEPLFQMAPRPAPHKATLTRAGALSGSLATTVNARYADFAATGCAKGTGVAALSPSGAVLGRATFPASCGQSAEVTFTPWTESELAQICGSDWDGRVKPLRKDVLLKVCTEGHACDAKDPGATSTVHATGRVQCGTADRAAQLKAIVQRSKANLGKPRVSPRLHNGG